MVAEPLEIEVKLGVSRPRVVGALLAHPDPARLAGFTADGPLMLKRLTDVYVDTAPRAGRLFLAAMRARLRFKAGTVTLAVKRSGVEVAGVPTRVELEGPATRALHPGRWPASAARDALLGAIGGERLEVIARLRQRRLVRIVRRGPTRVELSLDALAAVSGGAVVARRHELEAELVDGNENDLATLADALRAVDGVGPALGSKLVFALGEGPSGGLAR